MLDYHWTGRFKNGVQILSYHSGEIGCTHAQQIPDRPPNVTTRLGVYCAVHSEVNSVGHLNYQSNCVPDFTTLQKGDGHFNPVKISSVAAE